MGQPEIIRELLDEASYVEGLAIAEYSLHRAYIGTPLDPGADAYLYRQEVAGRLLEEALVLACKTPTAAV